MQHYMPLINYLVRFCGHLKRKAEFWGTDDMISLTIISPHRWSTRGNFFLERGTTAFTRLIHPTENFSGALRQAELFIQPLHYITTGCLSDPLTEIFTRLARKRAT